jgi:phosphoserine phosphatase
LLADAAGTLEAVASVTADAMHGRLDFAASLTRRVALLEGLPVTAIDAAIAQVRVTRGVPELVAGVHAADGLIAAVSGGFHEVLDPIAERLGLDRWTANRLDVADGRLTGRLDGPIIDAAAKADALRGWAAEAGIPLDRCVAVGDGANDLRMLDIAGLGVAFDAKPILRAAADIALDVRDLAELLVLLPRG